MFKKIVALLLTLTLAFSIIPQAGAARLENSIYLSPSAFSSSDHIWREFSNFNPVNMVMAPGEWIVTPAFHAVDGWILSYSGLTATSSDPYVAEAKVTYVGASPVGGVANSFVGLEIHAKNPGTALITVNYATFVTNSQYTDNRATPYSTKTFSVTVTDNALDMDVAMSTNEVVLDWPDGYRDAVKDYKQGMEAADEKLASTMLSAGLTAMITGGSMLAGMGVATALGVAAGAVFMPVGALAVAGMAVGLAVGMAVNVGMEQAKGSADPLTNSATGAVKDVALEQGLKGLPGMKEMVDVAEAAYKAADADLNNELRKFPYPSMNPASVDVYVRLTNTSSQDIPNVVLELSSENLSFTSSNGPWKDAHREFVGLVSANSTVTRKVTVFPKEAYHSTASGVSQLMYTGTVAVQCRYRDLGNWTDVVLNDSAELHVYSKLNIEDQVKAESFVAPNAEVRTSCIMCPVDVLIQDAQGNTIATLTTDGEPYQDGTIIAGALGDMKYIIVPQDKKDDYQLKIVATEDGEMNIVGSDSGDTTNMSIYESVPLKKGDSFLLDLTEPVAATLHALKEDGTKERLDATLELNEATIATVLEQTDVTAENREKVAHALSRSLVPAQVLGGSFQSPITLEQYAALVANLYEKRLGMLPGDLTDMYLAENTEEAPVSVPVAVAAWKGLLNSEYNDAAMQEDASTRLLTVEEMLMAIVNLRDILQWTAGIPFDPDPLTLEQLICLTDAMWTSMNAEGKAVMLAEELTEEIRGEMTGRPDSELSAVAYYREGETQKSILRNSMLYYPAADAASISASEVVNCIYQGIQNNEKSQNNGVYPDKVVDWTELGNKDFSIEPCVTGSGIQITDEQGWSYTWLPFYISVQDGKIYKDTVYLAVFRGHEGADEATLAEYGFSKDANNRMEYYIIADQERVGSFLAEQHLLDKVTLEFTDYPELKRGSEGEEVRRLQEALIENNWLATEATGVYDGQTQQAVHGLQKQLGLKTTGVADANLQRVIYGEVLVTDITLETWLAPYVKKAERAAAASYGATQTVKVISNGNIRAEADANSSRIKGAKAGETYVCVGVEDNGWYHLRFEDGSEGYIFGNLVELVE